jgi:hypothetical protein
MNSTALNWNEIVMKTYSARLLFVTTELDVARSFASIASWWNSRSKLPWSADECRRNERLARTAYESAIHFMPRIGLWPADAEQLAAKQQKVESALEQLTATNNHAA